MAAREPVGHNPHSFLWSEPEYEPRTLLEEFQDYLPFVVMVTQGYCGDDELFAVEEIYWVRDVAYQERVVCRDSHNEYYSVPLSYPEPVTPSHSNGVEGPQMSLEDLKRLNDYRFFNFKRRVGVLKNEHLNKYDLGRLEIVNKYQERFLILHTILSGDQRNSHTRLTSSVAKEFSIMPVFTPVALTVAVEMAETETENFERTMYNFRKFANTQPQDYDRIIRQNSDIVAYEDVPVEGEYEYLQYVRVSNKHGGTEEHGYCTVIVSRDEMGHPRPKPLVNKSGGSSSAPVETAKSEIKPQDRKFSFRKKKTTPTQEIDEAPSRSIKISKEVEEIYDEITEEETLPKFTPTPLSCRQGPVALHINVEDALRELRGVMQSNKVPKSTWRPKPTKKTAPQPSLSPRQDDSDLPEPTPPPPLPPRGAHRGMRFTNSTSRDTGPSRDSTSRDTGPSCDSTSRGTELSRIPKDISKFTIQDVSRCLNLLNMSQYVERFAAEQVDGKLLLRLDENILQTEFQMTEFHARKLEMFARDGWRLLTE